MFSVENVCQLLFDTHNHTHVSNYIKLCKDTDTDVSACKCMWHFVCCDASVLNNKTWKCVSERTTERASLYVCCSTALLVQPCQCVYMPFVYVVFCEFRRFSEYAHWRTHQNKHRACACECVIKRFILSPLFLAISIRYVHRYKFLFYIRMSCSLIQL